MPQTSITDFDVLRTDQTELITTFVRDPATEDLTDVVSPSTFTLIDIADDSAKVTQTFTSGGAGVVTHPATGTYQYSFDASTYDGEYLMVFKCVLADDVVKYNTYVKSVSARTFAYAAMLRAQVDKARKSISDDIENMDKANNEPAVQFFYGYTDAHLIFYLERGMQILNAMPPYTAMSIDSFPFAAYGSLLIDAATIAALEAQGIFAIDTDFNYALGGNSLVIDHFSKLSSMLSTLLARFDKQANAFKQQFRSVGTVLAQHTPGGAQYARLYNSLPGGFWSRIYSGQ